MDLVEEVPSKLKEHTKEERQALRNVPRQRASSLESMVNKVVGEDRGRVASRGVIFKSTDGANFNHLQRESPLRRQISKVSIATGLPSILPECIPEDKIDDGDKSHQIGLLREQYLEPPDSSVEGSDCEANLGKSWGSLKAKKDNIVSIDSLDPIYEGETPAMQKRIGKFLKKHFPKTGPIRDDGEAAEVEIEKKDNDQRTTPGSKLRAILTSLHTEILSHQDSHTPQPLSPVPRKGNNLVDNILQLSNHKLVDKSQDEIGKMSSPPSSPPIEGQKLLSIEGDIGLHDRDSSSEWHFPKFHFPKMGERRSNSESGDLPPLGRMSIGNRSRATSGSFKLDLLNRSGSEASFTEKYGKRESVVGRGAFATVRIVHKKAKESKWFAVKEFRKKRKEESEKDYIKKVIAEFCISSSLHHPNIVETLDLIKDESGRWCEVMEYCSGGDLLAKIQNIGLGGNDEIFCYFKQILSGIAYIHEIGVVHRYVYTNKRDLKPENILLDGRHRILKITDFGVSTVFKTQFEKDAHLVHGICGSAPYIAPEEWLENHDYQPTKVDIWACGMILYVMLSKGMLWTTAQHSNQNYVKYLKKRETGFPPFETQDPDAKGLLYLMLDPEPAGRPEAKTLLLDTSVEVVQMCTLDGSKEDSHTHLTAH